MIPISITPTPVSSVIRNQGPERPRGQLGVAAGGEVVGERAGANRDGDYQQQSPQHNG